MILELIADLTVAALFNKWRGRHGVLKASLMALAVVLAPLLLIGALLAAIILWSAPADAAPARANRCGVGLIAGVAGCITWEMKVSDYRDLIARAMVGDEDAMLELASFEFEREDRDGAAIARQWWELAAGRGSCTALNALINTAEAAGTRAERAKWERRARAIKCKVGIGIPLVGGRVR